MRMVAKAARQPPAESFSKMSAAEDPWLLGTRRRARLSLVLVRHSVRRSGPHGWPLTLANLRDF
jgi:hypothetical protein